MKPISYEIYRLRDQAWRLVLRNAALAEEWLRIGRQKELGELDRLARIENENERNKNHLARMAYEDALFSLRGILRQELEADKKRRLEETLRLYRLQDLYCERLKLVDQSDPWSKGYLFGTRVAARTLTQESFWKSDIFSARVTELTAPPHP